MKFIIKYLMFVLFPLSYTYSAFAFRPYKPAFQWFEIASWQKQSSADRLLAIENTLDGVYEKKIVDSLRTDAHARDRIVELCADTLLSAKLRLALAKYFNSEYGNESPWMTTKQVYLILKSLSLKDALDGLEEAQLGEWTEGLKKTCASCGKKMFSAFEYYVHSVKQGITKADPLLELDAEATRQFGSAKNVEEFESILEKPRLNSSPANLQVKLDLIFRGFDYYKNLKPKDFVRLAKHLNTPLIFESKNFEKLTSLLEEEKDGARNDLLSVLKSLDLKQFSAEQVKNYADFNAHF